MTKSGGKEPRPIRHEAIAQSMPTALPAHQPVRPAGLVADDGGQGYPFVVIRLMNAVYQAENIRVQKGSAAALIGWRKSFIQHPEPVKPDGQLGEGAKDLLIDAVLTAVRRTGFRMCIVWGPAWCSFVEPDGSINASFEPPSGGVRLPRPIVFDCVERPGPGDHAEEI